MVLEELSRTDNKLWCFTNICVDALFLHELLVREHYQIPFRMPHRQDDEYVHQKACSFLIVHSV